MKSVILGKGVIGWPEYERKSNRYGSVTFWDGKGAPSGEINLMNEFYGKLVRLKVKVIGPLRPQDTCLNDQVRGFHARLPKIGDEFILAEGYLFGTPYEEVTFAIGLIPSSPEKRASKRDWMNPTRLYNVYNQWVEVSLIISQNQEWFEHYPDNHLELLMGETDIATHNITEENKTKYE